MQVSNCAAAAVLFTTLKAGCSAFQSRLAGCNEQALSPKP